MAEEGATTGSDLTRLSAEERLAIKQFVDDTGADGLRAIATVVKDVGPEGVRDLAQIVKERRAASELSKAVRMQLAKTASVGVLVALGGMLLAGFLLWLNKALGGGQ